MIHPVTEGKQADRIDIPRDSRGNLADCYQCGLLEDIGVATSYYLQMMVYVPETFVLCEIAEVVAVDNPVHERARLRVAEFLEQTILPAHDDGLCQVLLAYEVELGKHVGLEKVRLVDKQYGTLAVVADEVENLMDLPEHRGRLVCPRMDAERSHALPEDLYKPPLSAYQVDDLIAFLW